MTVNKQKVIESFIAMVEEQIRLIKDAAENARERSNESEGRLQSRYDTQRIETGYLAEAYSQKLADYRKSLVGLQQIKRMKTNGKVQVGSLMEINRGEQKEFYLLVPVGGGLTLSSPKITTISVQAPLGRRLIGAKAGDTVSMPDRQGNTEIKIVNLI
ncbi:MAG: hypothetical protein Kow0037_30930 [Calditrichia bacterium]